MGKIQNIKDTFRIIKDVTGAIVGIIDSRRQMPEKLQNYLKWVEESSSNMDAEKLQGRGQAIPLSLPEIFIPLYGYDSEKKKQRKNGKETSDQNENIADIEELILKNDYLVISGQAGSGKTTVLKHLSYTLAIAGKRAAFIPVLIFLKDLNLFFIEKKKENCFVSADEILAWYFENIAGNIIDFKSITSFMEKEKLKFIFLLDGLDEIKPEYRKKIIEAFANLKIEKSKNKIVFSGRPHGIDSSVVSRFGEYRAKILSLNKNQIKAFITKWFAYLYKGEPGKKDSNAMLEEIKTHQGVARLIDNPLMLTAICMLYHDQKRLPEQRAELYKKFIDNMLFRRKLDKDGIVHEYLKKLAFKMHTKRIKAVGRTFAVDILKGFYKKEDKESKIAYKDRINKKFDDIEMRCGLIKYDNGDYIFWHLTFQEFLTADYIADTATDHAEAIRQYWNDDWYKEVIELYIGYLSMEHKGIANNVVSAGLDMEDKSPYKRWLTASHSLLDIEEKRRYDEIVAKSRKRLWEIIDNEKIHKVRADTGETLGWLGDTRDLKKFIKIKGGEYDLERIGEKTITPFEISKFPVTNLWYKEFIDAGGYENEKYWSNEGKKWLDDKKTEKPKYWDDRKWNCPNLPVVGVSWYEADAFLKWVTLERNDGFTYRLPSEKEWQAAAAGKEKRKYPWGNDRDENKCNNRNTEIGKTSAVGIFKAGDTPDGISDMAGNVDEWTSSFYDNDKNSHHRVAVFS